MRDAEPFPVIRAIELLMGIPTGGGSLGPQGGLYEKDGAHFFIADYRRSLKDLGGQCAFSMLWGAASGSNSAGHSNFQLEALADLSWIVLVEFEPHEDAKYSLEPRRPEYARHLRAVDWALAFHCGLAKQREAQGRNATDAIPRIAILDLTIQARGYDGGVWDIDGIPSVRVFGPRRGTEDMKAFADMVKGGNAAPLPAPLDMRRATSRIARRWTASLAGAGDAEDPIGRSHYLNNLLGPLALAVELDRQRESSGLREAVSTAIADSRADTCGRQALMRAIEWTCPPADVPQWTEVRTLVQSLHRELRVLVLDDQIEDGWLPILADALGVTCKGELSSGFAQVGSSLDGAISLWVASRPTSVEKALINGGCTPSGLPTPLRLSEDIGPGAEPSFDEILFVDLRLFGAAARTSEEMHFESWVSGELAEDWSPKGAHDAERLTGLARLIAKRDHTYPVVIWSSTGRREILEALRVHGSIYAGLRKPRFDAYGTGAADFVSEFSHAIRSSFATLQARRWIDALLHNSPASTSHDSTFRQLKAQLAKGSHHLVSMYFDESGTADANNVNRREFRHGGFAVVATWTGAPPTGEQKERLVEGTARLLDAFGKLMPLSSDPMLNGCKLTLIPKGALKSPRGTALRHSQAVLSAMRGVSLTENDMEFFWFLCAMPARLPKMAGSSASPIDNPGLDYSHLKTLSELVESLVALCANDRSATTFSVQVDHRLAPADFSSNTWKQWLMDWEIDAARVAKAAADSELASQGYPPAKRDSRRRVAKTSFWLKFDHNRNEWNVFMPTVTGSVLHALVAGVAQSGLLTRTGAFGGARPLKEGSAEAVVADFVPRNLLTFSSRTQTQEIEPSVFGSAPSLVDLLEVDSLRGLLDAIALAQSDANVGSVLIKCFGEVQKLKVPVPELTPNSFVAAMLSKIADLILGKMSAADFLRFRDSCFPVALTD